eukprot:5886962-Prymnesium_polylepis.1
MACGVHGLWHAWRVARGAWHAARGSRRVLSAGTRRMCGTHRARVRVLPARSSARHRAEEVSQMQSTLSELGSLYERFTTIVASQE